MRTQVDEFARLYGAQPNRVDGHHHAHLCANVQWQKLIPGGIMVRRNFTFRAGEKGGLNRFYRGMQDRNLARRYRIADFFFNLMPLEEGRLREILKVAGHAIVEIECHPERDQEYEFLMQGRLKELGRVHVSRGYVLRRSDGTARQARGESDHSPGNAIDMSGAAPGGRIPHISVCICTYMRPQPLKRLLGELDRQKTDGLFAYSAVVADNDEARSGEAAINEIREALSFPVKYCVEPQRGIARARNRVLANAEGDYVALIDDDEFPVEDWLLRLLLTLCRYDVDGVLGPVKRYFDGDPPSWLKRSRLYDRAVNPTGMPVAWRKARTGNVLLKREVFSGDEAPFNVEFKSGEDHDFFRRKELEGCSFVWSAEAITYEVLPPARWTRSYLRPQGVFARRLCGHAAGLRRGEHHQIAHRRTFVFAGAAVFFACRTTPLHGAAGEAVRSRRQAAVPGRHPSDPRGIRERLRALDAMERGSRDQGRRSRSLRSQCAKVAAAS